MTGKIARVYKYRVYGDLPDAVIDEIRRGHQLWNTLTGLYLRYEKDKERIWSGHPDLGEAAAAVEAADAHRNGVIEKAKQERRANRSPQVSATTRDELARARSEHRRAKAHYRQIKDRVYPSLKPRFAAAKRAYTAAVKATYATAMADGLYWGTYNDIAERHRTRVTRIEKDRRAGRPAAAQFRRWDGTGTIAVQLQRQKHKPARTPAMLADIDTGVWRNVFALRHIRPTPNGRPCPAPSSGAPREPVEPGSGSDPVTTASSSRFR